MTLVSIIVPVVGPPELTLACLEAIAAATDDERTPYEIVLAETEPATAGQQALYDTLQGDVRIASTTEGRTLAGGVNDGAAIAAGDVLVLVEPGVLPRQGWLEGLLAGLAAADVAGTSLADGAGVLLRGAYGFRVDPWIGDMLEIPLYAGLPADHPLVAKDRACRSCAGGALALSPAAFTDLGGLEDGLDGLHLWLDFGLRASEAGYRLTVAGRAVVTDSGLVAPEAGDEFVYGERFRERWSATVSGDVFDHYLVDAVRLAGVRGPDGRLARTVLVHGDAAFEGRHLEPPWPGELLAANAGKPVMPAVDGGPGWHVPPGAVDRSAEQATHYDISAQDGLSVAHEGLIGFLGGARRIMELGCASGYLTRHLVAQGCTVVGVEIDPVAAERAAGAAERIVVGDLDSLDIEAAWPLI